MHLFETTAVNNSSSSILAKNAMPTNAALLFHWSVIGRLSVEYEEKNKPHHNIVDL